MADCIWSSFPEVAATFFLRPVAALSIITVIPCRKATHLLSLTKGWTCLAIITVAAKLYEGCAGTTFFLKAVPVLRGALLTFITFIDSRKYSKVYIHVKTIYYLIKMYRSLIYKNIPPHHFAPSFFLQLCQCAPSLHVLLASKHPVHSFPSLSAHSETIRLWHF